MATVYDVGDAVRVYSAFRANTITVTAGVPAISSATLTDPTTVTLLVETPAGVQTSYTYAAGEVTKDSTGVFYRTVTLNASGQWIIRWTGTGAVASAGESTITVRPQTAS